MKLFSSFSVGMLVSNVIAAAAQAGITLSEDKDPYLDEFVDDLAGMSMDVMGRGVVVY